MPSLKTIFDGRELFFVDADQSVAEVADKMAALNVGAILVLERRTLAGIFSERDLLTRVVVDGKKASETPVRSVMTANLATIAESASTDDAMAMMQERKCRHLPVLRGSEVIGLISMRDLMNVELERNREEIQQMRAYIHGS